MAKKTASKKTASKKTPAKKKVEKVDKKLLAAAKNLNEEMGLTKEDVIDLEGTAKEIKAGIVNAVKYIEDSDTFKNPTWNVLKELELVTRPAAKTEEEEEGGEDLELMVGSSVTVDFDGEEFPGTVTKLTKKKATVEFEDGDTDDIPVGDVTVTANPETEEEEEPEPAPKKKRNKKAAPKKEVEEPVEPEEPELEVGSRVSVDFDGTDYEGVVTKLTKKKATIDFDDDSSDSVDLDDVVLLLTKPKKERKAKKDKPAKKKEAREPGTPSSKETVYKAWAKKKGGTKDPEELFALVDEAVQLTTIKSWTKAWSNGKRLPACAKK